MSAAPSFYGIVTFVPVQRNRPGVIDMKHFRKPAQSAGKREELSASGVSDMVAEIIRDVAERKDAALAEYEKRYSRSDRSYFRVDAAEIKSAYAKVPEDLVEAIRFAAGNIKDFARAQLDTVKELPLRELRPGVWLGHRVIPVDSCCCYVPGGRYPLFSTALMLAVPAKASGVGRVYCCMRPPWWPLTSPESTRSTPSAEHRR